MEGRHHEAFQGSRDMLTNDEVDDPDMEESPVRDPPALRLLPVDGAPRAALEVDRRGLFLQQCHRRRRRLLAGHLGLLLNANYVKLAMVRVARRAQNDMLAVRRFKNDVHACVVAWELL